MSDKLEIIGWVDWLYGEHPEATDLPMEQYKAYEEALISHIKEHQLCFTGTDHQYTPNCVPLFNDGSTVLLSMRGWGRVMWEVHKEKFDDTDDRMGYATFAWSLPDWLERKLPLPQQDNDE